jgi:hypothetical protein
MPSANSSSQWEASKALKKKNTSKYMLLTLLSQTSFAFTERNLFISMENQRSTLKILNQRRLILRPRSIHTCQQEPNPSGDPVPLNTFLPVNTQ